MTNILGDKGDPGQMLPGILFSGAIFIFTFLGSGPLQAQPAGHGEVDWQLLETYCDECHNFDDQAGSVAFDIMSRDALATDADIWELAIRKMRTGLMPPAGKARPERGVLDDFVAQLETRLDNELAVTPNPGNEGASRLNRSEYTNAVRDLLGYDATAIVATLPPDEAPDGGFDNMADALSVSPTLIDAWVGIAMRISREAVGDRAMIPTQVKYPAGGGAQTKHVDGLPLGTRGGMLVTHNFPLDAEYEIRVQTQGASGVFNPQDFCAGPSVLVTLNGETLEVDDPRQFPLQIPAGPQTFGVALVDDKRCEGVNDFYDVFNVGGAIQALEVHGPFEVSGAGDTPSRRAIFTCYPDSTAEAPACARSILANLATRAYRRPVAEQDPELVTLLQFYERGLAAGDFETGIQYALSRLLIDPRFLYQAEEEPAGLAPGEIYAISELELATRLSFFLWSSIPDQTLLDLAVAGRLSDPAVLEAQVSRMLQDGRANALVQNFAAQWLKLRELDAALPQDPAFNSRLRRAFRSETELLFTDMVMEDRSLLHLLAADYTWLNEDLARHYDIRGIRGDYLRKVPLPADSPRRGLLGQGSILTATSVANRTSPVIRGEWIVENILGAPVPVPPPGVETDLTKDTAPDGRVARTLRDRLEMHLQNPTCASCHQVMDPVGYALENFDLIGRWRESEDGYPLNTVSEMVDGSVIDGPVAMREALLARGDTVATSMTEKLLGYALGREVEAYDMPAVRKVVRAAAAEDYRFSTVILGIVNSLPFRMKTATGGAVEVATHVAGGQ